MTRRGVYPGSFNPPTVAHLAIADAARVQRSLDVVHLAVSRRALNKEHIERPRLAHRLDVLRRLASRIEWLDVVLTDAQLLVDIADGYDVLVLGADKWEQVLDTQYYDDSPLLRDAAVARLPELAIAPRVGSGSVASARLEQQLAVPAHLGLVSSTQARAGDLAVMVQEAAEFDSLSGAWTDPQRYDKWLLSQTVAPAKPRE